jgi:hypothetical protein
MLEIAPLVFGAFLAVAGLALLLREQKASGNKIKFLGQEFELSSTALVVVVMGCAIFALPFLTPLDDAGASLASEGGPPVSTRGVPPANGSSAGRIDSGYSRTFVFSNDSLLKDNFILFYAGDDQDVLATIKAQSRDPDAKLQVLLDQRLWQDQALDSFSVHEAKLTDRLRFDVPPGRNMHMLRFVPQDLDDGEVAVVDALVLVHDNKEDS